MFGQREYGLSRRYVFLLIKEQLGSLERRRGMLRGCCRFLPICHWLFCFGGITMLSNLSDQQLAEVITCQISKS